ncbi:MAG TPA: SMP-30/gluconolactonase/LRE family protein [Chthonomonadaceae bacterium]|nr:SMP-30/gluconolactonase/LRE family protein [Chthonomonadaceae bacterium]
MGPEVFRTPTNNSRGNIYCTGSGGVQVFAPSGKRLGTIEAPEVAANCACGDADARTLYITASPGLYHIRTKIAGQRP